MKNKDLYLVGGCILIAVLVLGFAVGSMFGPDKPNYNFDQEQPIRSFSPFSTGSTESGDVALELTPAISAGGLLTVSFSANTHSVSLEQFNLQEVSFLETGGKKIKPLAASSLSGHHVQGTILFQLPEATQTFTIVVQGLPKLQERKYLWG